MHAHALPYPTPLYPTGSNQNPSHPTNNTSTQPTNQSGLGVLSGLVALGFRYLLAKSEDLFKGKTRRPALNFMANVPRFFKPVIGGAICGLTGILFPQVSRWVRSAPSCVFFLRVPPLSGEHEASKRNTAHTSHTQTLPERQRQILFFGYETLDGLIANQSYPAVLLLGLLLLKAVMTSLCFGSGLVGGLFAPSLFLGATAGAAYQKLVSTMLQYGVASLIPIAGPPAYAMVGAASVLASMFRAPLTGSLLLFELTRCVPCLPAVSLPRLARLAYHPSTCHHTLIPILILILP